VGAQLEAFEEGGGRVPPTLSSFANRVPGQLAGWGRNRVPGQLAGWGRNGVPGQLAGWGRNGVPNQLAGRGSNRVPAELVILRVAEDLLFAFVFSSDKDSTDEESIEKQPQRQRQKPILRYAKDDKVWSRSWSAAVCGSCLVRVQCRCGK